MRGFGRGLQVVGLVIPISGIFLAEETRGAQSMVYSFGALLVGAGIFYAGWLIQGKASGSSD